MIEMLLEGVGWASSVLLGLCAVPQMALCIRQGHARGLSKGTLWLWHVGELCLIIYGVWGLNMAMPVVVNGIIGYLCTLIILWYAYK